MKTNKLNLSNNKINQISFIFDHSNDFYLYFFYKYIYIKGGIIKRLKSY